MPDSPPKPITLTVLAGDDRAPLDAWVQLLRTVAVVQRRVVALLAARGLTLAQFDVLATLRFGEGLTQQELAARLLVTKGNVCGLLDRLAAAGWVERRPDAADARANRVHLTPAGRRKVAAALPAHDALIASALQSIAPAQVRALTTLLAAVEEANRDPE